MSLITEAFFEGTLSRGISFFEKYKKPSFPDFRLLLLKTFLFMPLPLSALTIDCRTCALSNFPKKRLFANPKKVCVSLIIEKI